MHPPLVLCYHAVSEDWDVELAVTPAELEAQLRHLVQRGSHGTTFHTAVSRPQEAAGNLAVTFDGGFRSTFELARPILARLGLPGTVFVPTGYVEGRGRAEWPGVDVWLEGPHEDELSLMGWDDLRALSAYGWEIGAHSRWHPRLTELDDEALEEELRGSRADCAAALGRPCRSLSYPFGDVNPRVVAAAASAGFEAAASLPTTRATPDRLNWPRVHVRRGESRRSFRLESAGTRAGLRIARKPAPRDPLDDRTQFAGQRRSPERRRSRARVAVVVPCHDDGRFLSEALQSIREKEPVEIVVVDDASSDAGTVRLLERLRERGVRVVRHRVNRGLSAARMSGVRSTTARYVFPLDSDDLLIPGALAAMADRMDADPGLAACYGDHRQFGTHERIFRSPERLDPYRLAYRNEYPGLSMFRRGVLEQVGGWRDVDGRGYEDWNLWMTLAERGHRAEHIRPGTVVFAYRLSPGRMRSAAAQRHRELYAKLRHLHPGLFSALPEHRRSSTLGRAARIAYPLVWGPRRRRGILTRIRAFASRTGLAGVMRTVGGHRR